MTTAPAQEINIAETFFQAVSTGVVSKDLLKLLNSYEPEEKAKIVNSLNSEGTTPMIVAVKENNKDMVELLFDKLNVDICKTGRFKWKKTIYEEALPLFVAILSDNTPDQCIINFLVAKASIDSIATALRSVAESNTIPCLLKFDILDLIGSAYMLHPELDPERSWFATYCWSLALQLRDLQFNSSFDSSFLKTPNTLSAIAQKVFGQTTEFRTTHELQEVLSQESHLLLQTQALLVIQRVMSRLDPDPHPFFLRRLLQYSKMWFQTSTVPAWMS